MTERFIVPSERHVERLASGPVTFETLATLQARLLAELAPERTAVAPDVARLALGQVLRALARPRSFLGAVAGRGARPWQRTVDAVDEAILVVRQTGCVLALEQLARQEKNARAAVLVAAIAELDRALERLGGFDGRALNDVLVSAIRASDPARVAAAVRATRLTARFCVAWQPAELALWRALDEVLSPLGGRALIEVPTFEAEGAAIDPSRTSSVLDRLVEQLAAALDDAPATSPIEARLGDLRFSDPPSAQVLARVSVKQAADAEVQAWAVAEAVHAALLEGHAPERIAIALPGLTDETASPIRRALAEVGVALHDPRGRSPLASRLVSFALEALEVADRGLARADVAALLRSGYLDARALSGLTEDLEARATLARVARALEATPSASAEDPVSALEETVRAWETARGEGRGLAAVARYAGALLARAAAGTTRAEHVASARALWSLLGLAGRAATGARALLGRDGVATGIDHAELVAIARDAHAWEALLTAMGAYVAATEQLGLADVPATGETFPCELTRMLEHGDAPPAPGRAGAVRLVRAAEIAGEPLDLLVVADLNEGVVPAHTSLPAFFSPAFEARLRELDARIPSSATRSVRDLAELALAASAAERITLVYRTRDESGTILAPATLALWLERGGAAKASCRTSPVRERPLTARQSRLREIHLRPERASLLAPAASRRAEVERAREAFFGGQASLGEAPEVGMIAPDASMHRVLVEETGGGAAPMAVTALERFAGCAFQGYAAQILGAREWRPSADAPDAREQGSIVHGALAAAFNASKALWPARPRDAARIRALALDAADGFLEREAASSGLRRLALDEARREVGRVVEWSLADEEWDFVAAEQAFGDGKSGSWEAVRLAREESLLALKGSMDRVDVAHGKARVRVVDYKLSESAAERGAKGLGERYFQLPVYAEAAARNYQARESTGFYLPTRVKGPLPLGPQKPEKYAEAWNRATTAEGGLAPFAARAMMFVLAVRAGRLAPVPLSPHECDLCAFDGGCRKPRFAITGAHEDETDR